MKIPDESNLYDAQFVRRVEHGTLGQCCSDFDPFRAHHCQQGPEQTWSRGRWDPDVELAEMLERESFPDPHPPQHLRADLHDSLMSHRRHQPTPHNGSTRRNFSLVTILVAAIVLCALIMLSWSISYSYSQLRATSSLAMSDEAARWWPMMLYGPWIVAALSIMRSSTQQRSARSSWAVIVAASGVAVVLCIGNSTESFLMMAIAGIPPITALACFQELVGQLRHRYHAKHAVRSTRRGQKA